MRWFAYSTLLMQGAILATVFDLWYIGMFQMIVGFLSYLDWAARR